MSAAKTAAIAKVRPMTEYVEREISPVSFTAMLAAIFGALALLLAVSGIYGVFNYRISHRGPEMGIRMALGASGRDILQLVLREGLTLTSAGLLLGIAGAMVSATLLKVLLYNVGPCDPLSYGFALLLLPMAAFAGCWHPARRAAASSPAQVIREE